jgi:hypothetical protein
MRLWSLHPKYLDRAGLLALWREALLAQAVLLGKTRGYRNHPQLDRFRGHPDPEGTIAAYLHGVRQEGVRRGYRFDAAKIVGRLSPQRIGITRGQLLYERAHLERKLAGRDPLALSLLRQSGATEPHPLFAVVAGPVEPWEKQPSGKRGG